MDDIKLALLGDKAAQEECTRQGIVLACPCCANEHISYDTSQGDYDYGMGGYRCYDCGLSQGYNFKSEEEALYMWNTRAPILTPEELGKLEESL